MATTLAPLRDEDWPEAALHLRGGFAGRLNVYRAMAHHPALLTAWESFRNHVVLASALTPQQSEIVILRTGVRRGSRYEWMHHVLRGLDAGLSPDRIAATRVAESSGIAGEDALLVAAVDALVDRDHLPSPLLDTLTEAIGARGVLDVIATVGLYSILAAILLSYDVPAEPGTLTAFAATPFADQPDP